MQNFHDNSGTTIFSLLAVLPLTENLLIKLKQNRQQTLSQKSKIYLAGVCCKNMNKNEDGINNIVDKYQLLDFYFWL